MTQPLGFENNKNPNAVCKLTKSLYGLKQAPRNWNSSFVQFLKQFNFIGIESDPCVFRGEANGYIVFLALYVDDGLIMSMSKGAIDVVLRKIKKHFEITIVPLRYYVGLEIERDRESRKIKISQSEYIKKLITRLNMQDTKPSYLPAEPNVHLSKLEWSNTEKTVNIPYREAIGSLLFVARISRPDIEYSANQASQYITCYGASH